MQNKFTIDDFLLKEPTPFNISGIARNLDFDRMCDELSDIEFAQFYFSMMQEYRDHHGWWSGRKIPKCSQCNEVISGPEELRRLYGLSLHPNCFEEVYQEKRDNMDLSSKKYFDRVLEI